MSIKNTITIGSGGSDLDKALDQVSVFRYPAMGNQTTYIPSIILKDGTALVSGSATGAGLWSFQPGKSPVNLASGYNYNTYQEVDGGCLVGSPTYTGVRFYNTQTNSIVATVGSGISWGNFLRTQNGWITYTKATAPSSTGLYFFGDESKTFERIILPLTSITSAISFDEGCVFCGKNSSNYATVYWFDTITKNVTALFISNETSSQAPSFALKILSGALLGRPSYPTWYFDLQSLTVVPISISGTLNGVALDNGGAFICGGNGYGGNCAYFDPVTKNASSVISGSHWFDVFTVVSGGCVVSCSSNGGTGAWAFRISTKTATQIVPYEYYWAYQCKVDGGVLISNSQNLTNSLGLWFFNETTWTCSKVIASTFAHYLMPIQGGALIGFRTFQNGSGLYYFNSATKSASSVFPDGQSGWQYIQEVPGGYLVCGVTPSGSLSGNPPVFANSGLLFFNNTTKTAIRVYAFRTGGTQFRYFKKIGNDYLISGLGYSSNDIGETLLYKSDTREVIPISIMLGSMARNEVIATPEFWNVIVPNLN